MNSNAEMPILRTTRMTADHFWGMRLGLFFGGTDTVAVLDTTRNVGISYPFHHIYQMAVTASLSVPLYGLPLHDCGR